MKKLTGLNEEIRGYNGLPVKGEGNKNMIIKDIILSYLAQTKNKTSKEDLIARKLMFQIDDIKNNELEIEDSHFEILKNAVELNNLDFPAVIRGAVYEIIENSEKG